MVHQEEEIDKSQRQQNRQAQAKEISSVAYGQKSSPIAEEEQPICSMTNAGSKYELIVKRHQENGLETTLQSANFSNVAPPPLSQLNLASDLDSLQHHTDNVIGSDS